MDARGLLRGLATLPLIGGSVALIGNPTAAAVPVTPELLHSYKSWLFFENRWAAHEMAGYDIAKARDVEDFWCNNTPGEEWHFQWAREGMRGPAGWIDAPQPSTRAAIVLSAVGVPLT